MKKNDLTCLGIIVLDVIANTINRFPEEGTTEYFDSMKLYPGGCAYNTGVAAKRLGLEVSIQCKVGNDLFGNFLFDCLQKENISTEKIAFGTESTSYSFVMLSDNRNRRIYHTPGVNNAYCLEDVDTDSIKESKVLHIAGSALLPGLDGEPTVQLLKFCKNNNVFTSMDPVYKKDITDIIVPSLPYLDLFLPNNEESIYITGYKEPVDQLNFYIDNGVKIAGIKMGEKGVLISNGTDRFKVGIYNVNVSDTTGAGDSFIAGFIYGILNEWDLLTSTKFATATAAHCVQCVGATSGVVEASRIFDFMSKATINIDPLF